jgi:hypothetical protein
MAEQLPHKLHEKIAEFQSQVATAADEEKEELERELLALRTSESERLESVSQRIAKSSAEWSKLEAATHQHLVAANEAVAKLAMGTANAIGKAQAAAEQALAQARIEAARSLGETSGQALRAIESAKTAALAELETRISQAAPPLPSPVAPSDAKPAAAPVPAAPAVPPPTAARTEPAPPAEAAPPAPSANAIDAATTAPKRPRKPRRDEAEAPAATGAPAAVAVATKPVTAEKSPPVAPLPDEPTPVPASRIPEIAPIAPPTAEPFPGHLATNGSASPVPEKPKPASVSEAQPKPARKRAPREDDHAPDLGLDLEQEPFVSVRDERVLTSDGATRLLVTAYIGIGNRLFIRGSGPGLSWEKGVPLQFVSIGKWRWETNDASQPVTFKLYKNDDLECAALGALSLEPGHQQEVTAAF